jgi:hypothetical protein
MWSFRSEPLQGIRGQRFFADLDAQPASFAEILRAWQDDAAFRSSFHAQLADAPYAAFRWETPPVTDTTTTRPFEFVLLDSPGLASHPDPTPFAEHFEAACGDGIVVFPNLGRDAIMVVPRPLASPSAYGHLAAFVRNAPEAQWHALWRTVGQAMWQRLGSRPVWLSTAGGGVSWLHVRLDDRPKYYGYGPYRNNIWQSTTSPQKGTMGY